MLKSSLFEYGDPYILAKRAFSVVNTAVIDAAENNGGKTRDI